MRYTDYLRNPNLTDEVIDMFIKNDCKVGISNGGWTIIKSELVTDHQRSEGVTYINILLRDDNGRDISDINYPNNVVDERLRYSNLYLTCLCYDRGGLGSFEE